ncbi:MAG: 4Fe-4S binding protein [Clostridiales bacterium]
MLHKKREEFPSYYPLSVPQEGAGGNTGSWRHNRPEIDKDQCTQCLFCYVFCPEGVISKEQDINYDYCKGCGICATECPQKAIKMIKEVE